MKPKWSLEKWCGVIGTIVAVFAVIWAIFIWYKPTPEKPQSTDINIAKNYDDRFESMTKKRASAAIAIREYLSKGDWNLVTNNTDGLDEVLGLFEIMGYDERRGLISPDVLHEYFYEDIVAYYQASAGYIAMVQKSDGASTYSNLKPLYDTMIKIEADKEHTNVDAVRWERADLINYFQSETNSVNLKEDK